MGEKLQQIIVGKHTSWGFRGNYPQVHGLIRNYRNCGNIDFSVVHYGTQLRSILLPPLSPAAAHEQITLREPTHAQNTLGRLIGNKSQHGNCVTKPNDELEETQQIRCQFSNVQ